MQGSQTFVIMRIDSLWYNKTTKKPFLSLNIYLSFSLNDIYKRSNFLLDDSFNEIFSWSADLLKYVVACLSKMFRLYAWLDTRAIKALQVDALNHLNMCNFLRVFIRLTIFSADHLHFSLHYHDTVFNPRASRVWGSTKKTLPFKNATLKNTILQKS